MTNFRLVAQCLISSISCCTTAGNGVMSASTAVLPQADDKITEKTNTATCIVGAYIRRQLIWRIKKIAAPKINSLIECLLRLFGNVCYAKSKATLSRCIGRLHLSVLLMVRSTPADLAYN